MGAYGSGRWHGHEKAVSVEDCFILDTSTFRDNWEVGQRHTSGRLIWQGQSHSSASYTLARGTREAALRLTYFCDSRRNDDTILLVPTRPHLEAGGGGSSAQRAAVEHERCSCRPVVPTSGAVAVID